VNATDAEGDPILYRVQGLPPGAVFDPQTHTFSWTPDYQSAGTYPNVHFIADDGLQAVSQFTTFVIAPAPQPPTLTRPADRAVRQGDPIRIQLQVNNPEGSRLRYFSDLLPPGAVLNPQTGLFQWTPAFTQHGTFKVPFAVSDGQNAVVQTTTFTILNV